MKVEVLYFKGCPHHEPTVELTKQVVSELGLGDSVEEVEVTNGDEANRLRFLGSPSVHVDGVDIDPEARVRTEYAMSCRMYGQSGVPPRELLEAALKGGA